MINMRNRKVTHPLTMVSDYIQYVYKCVLLLHYSYTMHQLGVIVPNPRAVIIAHNCCIRKDRHLYNIGWWAVLRKPMPNPSQPQWLIEL